MKFSTHYTSKLSAFILAIFLFAGCAGINDANFSQDIEDENVNVEERDYQDDRPAQDDAPIISNKNDEDVIISRPPND
ncbi:MAG: hypothetical protein WD266_12420 [Balneolales bacterium]